jgi:ubiquinone/menaquinone biosynthesis C-methylase UbiE
MGAWLTMNKSLRSEFHSVDHTDDPHHFVRYLDTTRATDFFQEIKQSTVTLMELRGGEIVADIGCGTGEDVRALAARVGPTGRVVGVDLSSTMIATATERSRDCGLNVSFVQGDVQKLEFSDGCFDALRAERLLQHTPDPDMALREMVRVLKPGGRIVSWEADLDLFIIDAPNYDTSRIMQRFICDNFHHGSIGHRLYRYFLDLGLADVSAMPLVRNFVDLSLVESAFDLTTSVGRAIEQHLLEADKGMGWLNSLSSASRSGQFVSTIGGFITFGRKV